MSKTIKLLLKITLAKLKNCEEILLNEVVGYWTLYPPQNWIGKSYFEKENSILAEWN